MDISKFSGPKRPNVEEVPGFRLCYDEHTDKWAYRPEAGYSEKYLNDTTFLPEKKITETERMGSENRGGNSNLRSAKANKNDEFYTRFQDIADELKHYKRFFKDKINEDMTDYFDYHYKPGFDIDLLRSNNYICHFLVVSSEVLEKTGGFLKEYDGAQDHDLIFRCIEQLKPENIKHIPKILYHWRAHEISTALNPDNKLYAFEAGKRAIEDHLKRVGLNARVMYTEHLGFFRVRYDPGELKYVSMTPGELALYDMEMLRSLPADAVMIIDEKVKPVNNDSIEELLGNMARPETGAAGGKLLTRDGRIDNAGYSFDSSGKLKPRFRGMNSHFSGYMHRASIQNETDRLDKSCVMIKKEALLEWMAEGGSMSETLKEFDTKRLGDKYVYVYDPFARFRKV